LKHFCSEASDSGKHTKKVDEPFDC